jgi:hypothetical protein
MKLGPWEWVRCITPGCRFFAWRTNELWCWKHAQLRLARIQKRAWNK